MSDGPQEVAAVFILRNATADLLDLAEAFLGFEQWLLPRLAGQISDGERTALQSFDLLHQRLRGLSALLELLARNLPQSAQVSPHDVMTALPLARQRDAILRERVASMPSHTSGSVEIF